ncbi:MAG: DUF853 family protein [Deltaproteobacteria bacterium]|jgi:GTPase SAR1 family protein|nr:DUF853 family protein [Deltaproteobacteria bacterium]
MADQINELEVFKQADFDSVVIYEQIWSNEIIDVPEIHREERLNVTAALTRLINSPKPGSPMGFCFSGDAGSGKTHLLSALRRETQTRGAYFIYVNLANANEFWPQALEHFLDSLRAPLGDGWTQALKILGQIFKLAGSEENKAKIFTKVPSDKLIKNSQKIAAYLKNLDPANAPKHANIVRAFLLSTSQDLSLSEIGYNWLLGQNAITNLSAYGLTAPSPSPDKIIRGLTWLMSLGQRATVLAIDQIDNILNYVVQNGPSPEIAINGFCDSLASLVVFNSRCLTVLSCLNRTWEKLDTDAYKSAMDRFPNRYLLSPLTDKTALELLVKSRLTPAFQKNDFMPPYPTWPFPDGYISSQLNTIPRKFLQACRKHQTECVSKGVVFEASVESEVVTNVVTLPPPSGTDEELNLFYDSCYKDTIIADWKDLEAEKNLWPEALLTFARYFCYEIEDSLPENTYISVEFPPNQSLKTFPSVHFQLHLEHAQGQKTDLYLGVRALLLTNNRAFINRLEQAMKSIGLDRKSPHKRLTIIRFDRQNLKGDKTLKTIKDFEVQKGQWLQPDESSVRHLAALWAVSKKFPHKWIPWAKANKPTQKNEFLRPELKFLLEGLSPSNEPDPEPVNSRSTSVTPTPPITPLTPTSEPTPVAKVASEKIYMGKLEAQPTEKFYLDLNDLTRHTIIFGGSGSGKTVTLRRLVEEAALQGISAIIVDVGNDLVRLGQKWPIYPANWGPEEFAKEKDYFANTAFKIYTPGLTNGRPILLTNLPDFSGVAPDEDLTSNIDIAADSLAEVIKIKDGVEKALLRLAIEDLVQNRVSDLGHLINFLSNLPARTADIFNNSATKAQKLVNSLQALKITNPLYKEGPITTIEAILDPGDKQRSISVFNLSGLGSVESQQIFVSQLAQSYFAWGKKHPKANLQGLLVIDEAKDFVPTVNPSLAKGALIRFASQARKYGLGFVLASQEPKSVHNQVPGNCSTQFFGKLSSPISIQTAETYLGVKGVIANLEPGHFFVKPMTGEIQKLIIPLGLSAHTGAAADDEIISLCKLYSE